MIRAVLDTNIIVSALLQPLGPPAPVFRRSSLVKSEVHRFVSTLPCASVRAPSMGELRHMRAALVLALVPFGAVPAAFGQTETFDVATFAAPAGWERLPGQGSLGFRAAGGTAQVFLFASRPTASSPEENFRADWTRLVIPALGNLPAPAPQREQRNEGWVGVSGAGTKGPGFAVVLFTATGNGRAMSIVASVAGAQHLGTIRAFFESLRFRDSAGNEPSAAPSGEPLPPSAPGLLSGLYYHVQAGMASGARLEVRTRFFLAGDRITRTFPYGDGDKFDRSRCSPDTCGTYALETGSVRVRWDNGQADRWVFQAVSDGIELDGTRFRRARAVTAAGLVGVWGSAGESGGAIGNVYRFMPDGSFTFGTGQGGLGGRYRVHGLTLLLTFSDGTERRRALFAASTSEPPGMLCIEGELFARR